MTRGLRPNDYGMMNEDTSEAAKTGAISGQNVKTESLSLPRESPALIWTRRFVLAGFWIVVIALGLPHWIWTTSIHRSELPVEAMNRWAEGQVCHHMCLPHDHHLTLPGMSTATPYQHRA